MSLYSRPVLPRINQDFCVGQNETRRARPGSLSQYMGIIDFTHPGDVGSIQTSNEANFESSYSRRQGKGGCRCAWEELRAGLGDPVGSIS
jgi:hypothetical protein